MFNLQNMQRCDMAAVQLFAMAAVLLYYLDVLQLSETGCIRWSRIVVCGGIGHLFEMMAGKLFEIGAVQLFVMVAGLLFEMKTGHLF